jgi:aldehyde dehydrogenase (NAD+)
VFADADLDKAAAAITQSILSNAGQACVAGSRLIVEEGVAAPLAEAIVRRMTVAKAGPTWDEATEYSPIISRRQLNRIHGIVEAAVTAGGECLFGGAPMDAPGYFYQPTLMAVRDSSSPAITEEIFGPVLTMQTFADEEEAVALADHPTYGLAAGLFTRDLSRALRLTRRLQAGTVWVNRYSRSRDHILPTGGYKRSGIGKDLGREAYQANRKSKSVLISL